MNFQVFKIIPPFLVILVIAITLALAPQFQAQAEMTEGLQSSNGEEEADTINNLPGLSRPLLSVIKSRADKREYRTLELANQIKVILVHDPKAEIHSAVALTVKAGFLNDPEELPGLAHYLEHFLFIGSEGEDVLDQYLAQNGGTVSNAYTKSSTTTYFFHSPHQNFEGGIDVFSNMFIDPLFAENVREGVAEAVEAEFQGGISSDSRRLRRVNYALTNSSHPYSRIFTGNKYTLWSRPMERSIDVRAELLKYFEKYYSAHLMTLAVVSQKNLDELQLMVEKYFGSIKNNHKKNDTQQTAEHHKMDHWGSPWGPSDLQTRIDIVPLNEVQYLLISFPIPDDLELYSSGSISYLRSLFVSSGPGSLFSLLKKNQWVSSITVDFDSPGKSFDQATLAFTLTLDGVQNIENIILHTFQYIEMLRRIGPQNWYWNELKRLKDTGFRYQENSESVQDLVSSLTEQMQHYPINQVWTSQYQPLTMKTTKFQPQLIQNLLNFLIPQAIRVISVDRGNSKIASAKEFHYGVEYDYRKIEPSLIQKWTNCGVHEELKFPSPNQFIPTLFDIKPSVKKDSTNTSKLERSDDDGDDDGKDLPKIIFEDDLSQLWFSKDDQFRVPKATILLHIMNPYTSQSARNKTSQNLFINLIDDLLDDEEETSSARKAGLTYSLASLNSGISIKVQGYDDKISLLFDKILQFCLNLTNPNNNLSMEDLTRRRKENLAILNQFEETKESYLRGKKNAANAEPNEKARRHLKHLLSNPYYTPDQLLEPAKDLTLDKVLEYARLIFSSKIRLQWLIQGNVLESEALQWHHSGLDHFREMDAKPLTPLEIPLVHQVKLPAGSCLLYKKEEENSALSAVHIYFQTAEEDNHQIEDQKKEKILLTFLDLLLHERCYDTLRSKEHLGYSVSCKKCSNAGGCGEGVNGFEIIVQGMKHPNYIEWRIHNLLETMAPTINNLTLEDFTNHKKAVETLLKSREPKSLNTKADLFGQAIEKGTYDFDGVHESLQVLEKISLEMVKNIFNTWINPASTQRKLLRIHIISTKAEMVHNDDDLMTNVDNGYKEPCKNPKLLEDAQQWKKQVEYFETPKILTYFERGNRRFS